MDDQLAKLTAPDADKNSAELKALLEKYYDRGEQYLKLNEPQSNDRRMARRCFKSVLLHEKQNIPLLMKAIRNCKKVPSETEQEYLAFREKFDFDFDLKNAVRDNFKDEFYELLRNRDLNKDDKTNRRLNEIHQLQEAMGTTSFDDFGVTPIEDQIALYGQFMQSLFEEQQRKSKW